MTEREAPPIDEIVDEKPRLDETGMASMPLDSVLKFEPEDRRMMDMLLKAADERLASEYAQLFEIEAQFISKVRQRLPVAAGGGYARNANGSYVEDWTQLTLKDMEEFVLAATQYIVFDSQQSINAQAEAAYATMFYHEVYSKAYNEPLSGTVDARAATATLMAQRERWRAQFCSHYWKKAKDLVDRMDAMVRRVERIYDRRMRMAELERMAERKS